MIAAAIVCAAAFAQAANYTWGNGSYSIDNWNGNQPINPDLDAPMYEGGKMLLFLGTVSYAEGTGFDTGTATLLNSGAYDGNQYMYGNWDPSAYSVGEVNKMGGEAYTLILLDNSAYTSLSDVKDGDHFVLRTGTSTTSYDADISDNIAEFIDVNAIEAGDWTKYSSVPEPTSGLLLLLGVAGLALRRRRA